MKKFAHGKKLYGLISVTSANFINLILTMITAFLLPLVLFSTEEYGYWQLYSLYAGYVAIFMFGFNDGIHLNYADRDYNEDVFPRFRTFRSIVVLLGCIGTLMLVFVSLFVDESKFLLLIIVALNVVPVGLNGFNLHINQITMRYKQYSCTILVEKIFFIIIFFILVFCKVDNYIPYILAATAGKYMTIAYHSISSREIFFGRRYKYRELSAEIKSNFVSGFVLMMSMVLNSSIIVVSRLCVENHYGISTFGAYSFALNTMIVANQFILAFSNVFYPILKRTSVDEYKPNLEMIDKVTSVFCAVLLISYFPICILVQSFYSHYAEILKYLHFLYPLFIFQCKSTLLIINTYKVNKMGKCLFWNNLLGVGISMLMSFTAIFLFDSVVAVAIATFAGYMIWFYFCQIQLYKERKWSIDKGIFNDIFYIVLFIAITSFAQGLYGGYAHMAVIASGIVYSGCLTIYFFKNKDALVNLLRCFKGYINN